MKATINCPFCGSGDVKQFGSKKYPKAHREAVVAGRNMTDRAATTFLCTKCGDYSHWQTYKLNGLGPMRFMHHNGKQN